MEKYDGVYDLMLNPDQLLAIKDEDCRAKVVDVCVKSSEATFTSWLKEMGFVGDSSIDSGMVIHHSLHDVFSTCNPLAIVAQLALAATTSEEVPYLALSALFMEGMVAGAAFVLEAQRCGSPDVHVSSEPIDPCAKLLQERCDSAGPRSVEDIPFPLDIDKIIQGIIDELNNKEAARDADDPSSFDVNLQPPDEDDWLPSDDVPPQGG